jgi:hypothetical protein
MVEPALPSRAGRGVPLAVCTIVLTALPPLLILALVADPPREFGILLAFGDLFLWIPALLVAIVLIVLAARTWQRIVGIVCVAVVVIGTPAVGWSLLVW